MDAILESCMESVEFIDSSNFICLESLFKKSDKTPNANKVFEISATLSAAADYIEVGKIEKARELLDEVDIESEELKKAGKRNRNRKISTLIGICVSSIVAITLSLAQSSLTTNVIKQLSISRTAFNKLNKYAVKLAETESMTNLNTTKEWVDINKLYASQFNK